MLANVLFSNVIVFQLFDFDNPLNNDAAKFLFSTEGHIFPLSWRYRRKTWSDEFEDDEDDQHQREDIPGTIKLPIDAIIMQQNTTEKSCLKINDERYYMLPLKNQYLHQVIHALQSVKT